MRTRTLVLLAAIACRSAPEVMPAPRVVIANPFLADATRTMSGRYRFPDGSLRIQFDPKDVLLSPIRFRNGATAVPPGAYELYVQVVPDERVRGPRRIEVGLGTAIELLQFEAPSRETWVGPIAFSTTAAATSVEMRGTDEVRVGKLWLQPADSPRPALAPLVAPGLAAAWQTLWIDLPARQQVAWFTPGAPVVVRARSSADQAYKAHVTCRVLDFHQREVATHRFEVSFNGHEQQEAIPVPDAFGPYLLLFSVKLRDGTTIEYQRAVARVAAPLEFHAEILGGHGNRSLLPLLGASWNRKWETGGHETTWAAVEPRRGEFVYKDPSYPAPIKTLGVLELAPSWAASAAPDAWLEYVGNTVHQFKDKIEAWEVFNERYHAPDPAWVSDHVKTLVATTAIIRREAPSSIVMSGGPPEEIQPGLAWWDALGKAGMFRPLDVISVHLYVGGGGLNPLDKDVSLHTFLGELRKLIDTHGGAGKPIWDTESGLAPNESFYIDRKVAYGYWDLTGFHPHDPVPYRLGAAMTARLLLVHVWHRVPWFYYQADAAYGNSWAIVDFDESPLPLAVAMAQLVRLLANAAPDGIPALPAGFWGLRFRKNDQTITALWSIGLPPDQTRTVAITLGSRVELRDMFNNPLAPSQTLRVGIEPLFVIGNRNDVDGTVATLRVLD